MVRQIYQTLKRSSIGTTWRNAPLCIALTICVVCSFLAGRNLQNDPQPLQFGSDKASPLKFRTSAQHCPVIDLDSDAHKQHLRSQSNEDQHLLTWFNGLCGGTYLEMGALDGVTYSNTYFLNKMMHWKGLLIELSPISYEKLKINRPDEIAVVNAAVCDIAEGTADTTLHFYEGGTITGKGGAISGVWEFTLPKYREDWWPGVTLADTTPIACRPLRDIIAKEISPLHKAADGVVYFDFLSLDCEGCEWVAIRSIDWSRTAFGIMVIEDEAYNKRKNVAVRSFLEERGYIYMGPKPEGNIWYVHPQFYAIYDHLLYPSTDS